MPTTACTMPTIIARRRWPSAPTPIEGNPVDHMPDGHMPVERAPYDPAPARR